MRWWTVQQLFSRTFILQFKCPFCFLLHVCSTAVNENKSSHFPSPTLLCHYGFLDIILGGSRPARRWRSLRTVWGNNSWVKVDLALTRKLWHTLKVSANKVQFLHFARKFSASQSRSTVTRTEKRRRTLTNKEDRNTADIREEDGQDCAQYLGGEVMLPDGGVGVRRRNGRESRYPALLRLALRDRKWEVGEAARAAGEARAKRRRPSETCEAALPLLMRFTVMEGDRVKFNGNFHHTCSSILSCRSSAASTASKNSSSLIRLLGPSCGESNKQTTMPWAYIQFVEPTTISCANVINLLHLWTRKSGKALSRCMKFIHMGNLCF